MHISSRAAALRYSTIRQISEKANTCGPDLVRLDIGDPDYPEPTLLNQIMPEVVAKGSFYAPTAGLPELRRRLALRHSEAFCCDVSPSSVVVTAGGTGALNAAEALFVDAGDSIAIPTPGYPNYRSLGPLLGFRTVTYGLDPARDWQPDLNEIEQLFATGTCAILLNSPHNPAGCVLDAKTILEIADLCRRYDTWIISDEVYAAMQFTGTPVSAFALAPDRVISAHSFSKEFSMTGYRIGYALVPDGLAERFPMVLMGLMGSPSSISQCAALGLVSNEESSGARTFYQQRQARVSELLAEAGIESWEPKGTFYRLIRLPEQIGDSFDFALRLIDHGVATVPGVAFGEIPGFGERYLRLSLTQSNERIEAGIHRLADAL
ncbi:MAG: pyridoxal phosphate-dependent aminotransferase [Acidipropionibacterium sp.]|jgi:aspartate aminotransferase/aminotransferase|nr:pyridoxal phosphate-dependent aminotransferase [Acidipropionibacterium sp.]